MNYVVTYIKYKCDVEFMTLGQFDNIKWLPQYLRLVLLQIFVDKGKRVRTGFAFINNTTLLRILKYEFHQAMFSSFRQNLLKALNIIGCFSSNVTSCVFLTKSRDAAYIFLHWTKPQRLK
jgi:hypothetical protein